DVDERLLEHLVLAAVDEDVEAREGRKPRPEERGELLGEEEELTGRDPGTDGHRGGERPGAGGRAAGIAGEHVPLLEFAAERRLAVGDHRALDDLPGGKRHAAEELRHGYLGFARSVRNSARFDSGFCAAPSMSIRPTGSTTAAEYTSWTVSSPSA